MRPNTKLCLVPVMVLLLGLCGCGAEGEPGRPQGDSKPYQAPAFADSVFHEDRAEGIENARIDLSCTELGIVGVSATSSSRLKFQVIKGDEEYTYDLPADGTPKIFPLQSGNGTYTFVFREHVVDKKYAVLYTMEADVTLKDEFQPFLRPSAYVDYDQDSDCVKKAAELAQNAGSALGVVEGVYEYICDNVKYDKEKAASVQTGYLPDPDETYGTGKGICFDYAALVAAMLRSQGIPTKLVMGYVSPDDVYHAWNMFYTEETGWVTVGYEVKADSWSRLDLTFSANGTDVQFIGDGGNYSDVYFY